MISEFIEVGKCYTFTFKEERGGFSVKAKVLRMGAGSWVEVQEYQEVWTTATSFSLELLSRKLLNTDFMLEIKDNGDII